MATSVVQGSHHTFENTRDKIILADEPIFIVDFKTVLVIYTLFKLIVCCRVKMH